VEAAMTLALQELGPEAMLINSRKAPVETGHLGQYEVVFGVADAPKVAAPAPEPAARPDRLGEQVADLKRELEGMRRALTRTAFGPPEWLSAAPDLSDAYAVLIANEVSQELVHEMVHNVEARAGKRSQNPRTQLYQRALIEEMESRFKTQPGLGRSGAKPRITALVGPPGAGKTTTLVKLAVNYGLAARRPVLLLSMDTYRIAAAEQLRAYSGILGVAFQVLDTVNALAQAIEENSGKELILIDTPGMGQSELAETSQLARFLASRPDIETQLTIPASIKPADASRVVDSFKAFDPQRLIFTRMDETNSFGLLFNEAARTGKPISFLTKGQRIPEDIEEATPNRIIGLVLNGNPVQGRVAA
jgi:flagellar biosynthesis protein FlhF